MKKIILALLSVGLSFSSADAAVSDGGFEVLWYRGGVLYGYTLGYRSFTELKPDGTFTFSSGADDSGFGTMKFTKNAYSIDDITYSVSRYDAKGEKVSRSLLFLDGVAFDKFGQLAQLIFKYVFIR